MTETLQRHIDRLLEITTDIEDKNTDHSDAPALREIAALLSTLASVSEEDSEGWRPIETAPKDGTPICVAETYRFLPYKPDGRRQMRKEGRWQRRTEHGWQNADYIPTRWRPEK